MSNKGVAIRYGDVAPEAKENFIPTASESQFDTLAQLQQYNLNFPNYSNPCELYSVVLDGTAQAFPSVPEASNLGLWSEQVSNDSGVFSEPIELTLTSAGQYSSQGLTFTFDTYNDIFANYLNIKWYRETAESIETLGDVDFYPDNAFYFCQKAVENYNKVVITFYSINMPQNRLKLRVIDYGYGTFFYGDELRNVKITQSIDPISSQIEINPCNFTLDSKRDMEYSFQAKQPLSVYFNGELRATTFVKSSKRKAKTLWEVQSEDYISLMDSVSFFGDIYVEKNAAELLDAIFTTAKVPYSLDAVFENVTVNGHIPFGTCRNALMQVAFAIGAAIDTSNSDVVKVFALDDEVKQTVPLNRIMQGQNFTDDETVTGVDVTAHIYEKKEAIADNEVVAYNAKDDGTGENILVKFSEPLHSLDIVGEGKILASSANYAIVNAVASDFRLIGYSYEHTTRTRRKNRDDVGATTAEKVVSISSATLVSSYNVESVLERSFDWLTRTSSVNLKIVEGKQVTGGDAVKWGERKWGAFKWGEKNPVVVTYDQGVNVGENINAETEYLGIVGGKLIKQAFSLNGGIIIKEAVLK